MESDARPNPDELLAQVRNAEKEARRGVLRIFFGYAAGVGKTYTMLEAAKLAASAGREVVIGYVEPHARPETQALTQGFETLPARQIEYRGVILRELDVDAALARRPDVLIVDELAHTNAVGSRHEKRWQDVAELLDAGINVWTTLNVQHIESLNDVVGQITGVVVRETVPDQVFDCAAEIELIDITPEELISRLRAGKVYVSEQAQRAIQSFFQRQNLTALRELSLRQAARRIHVDVESARREKAATRPWATRERLLVCVGPSPTTARVIRTAKRIAAALDADWLAVCVDLTGDSADSPTKQRVAQHMRLAERLGAETITLAGHEVAETILDYARSRNVTKIFLGKTRQSRLRRWLWGAVGDKLLEQSGDIDVYVIHGDAEDQGKIQAATLRGIGLMPEYAKAALVVAATSGLGLVLQKMHWADAEANTVMLFLAAVAWTAVKYGRGASVTASILSVLAFDFLFVPPVHTFAIADAQYIVTFTVMLIIGLVISTLTSRLRAQVESTRLRERRTSAQYELGKQLSSLYGDVFLAGTAGARIAEMFGGEVAIYLTRKNGMPEVVYGRDSVIVADGVSVAVAQWAIEHDQMAGAGTNTLPNAPALFIPLVGAQSTQGAIAVRVPNQDRLLDPEERRLLEACASQLALALERDRMTIDAAESRVAAETEKVRSGLLSSVSHDLKTPLAAIAGASGSLLETPSLDEATRRQLLETVADEAARLNRLLENVLQMSKIDAGASPPNLQWHLLEDVVGSALHRTRHSLAAHHVAVDLPRDLPLLRVDGVLLEQVFVNLFENAARHTPTGTNLVVQAAIDTGMLRVAVADDGPGIPVGDEQRVFERFYRASNSSDGGRGSGLGLAICRAIVTAHGGTIIASNRPGGGAEFVIRLPLAQNPPQVVVD